MVFLPRTDGGAVLKIKRKVEETQFRSSYIPVASFFTPECASFVTKLPFCDVKNSLPTATVFFREICSFGRLRFGWNSSPCTRGVDSSPDFPVAAFLPAKIIMKNSDAKSSLYSTPYLFSLPNQLLFYLFEMGLLFTRHFV